MVRPIIMRVTGGTRRKRTTTKNAVTIKVTQSPKKRTPKKKSIVIIPVATTRRGKYSWRRQAKADRGRFRKSVVAKTSSQIKAVGLSKKEMKTVLKPFRGAARGFLAPRR